MSSNNDIEVISKWDDHVMHEKIPRGVKVIRVIENSEVEIGEMRFRIYKELIDVSEFNFDIKTYNYSFVLDMPKLNEKIKQLNINNMSRLPSHKLSFLENGYSIEVPPPLNWWQRIVLIAGVGFVLLIMGLGLAYYRNEMEIARRELR